MPAIQGRGRRSLLVAFGLSLLLHLLFLLLPGPAKDTPSMRRFQVRRPPPARQLESYRASRPDLLLQHMERLPSPAFSGLPDAPLSTDILLPGIPAAEPPPSARTDIIVLAAKPAEFEAEELILPDLDELALEAVRQKAEEYEDYARIYLFDADTSDAESRNRSRARQVVERAIEAMDGRKALLVITEMRARVWIEADEHVIEQWPRPPVVTVQPYLYPVARWRYKGLDTFVNQRIAVEVSLDPKAPSEKYLFYNPAITQRKYSQLFGYRWFMVPSSCIGNQRQQGEAARWHFIDRFLGEGIVLSYIGIEEFRHQLVEVIQVDDRRYGHYFEAFFERRTGLLLATREGLAPEEQECFRRKTPGLPPVWDTVYQDYKRIQGVLTPHQLERMHPPLLVTIHLKIAYNGLEPDRAVPDLAD